MKTFSPCRFFLRGYSKLRAHSRSFMSYAQPRGVSCWATTIGGGQDSSRRNPFRVFAMAPTNRANDVIKMWELPKTTLCGIIIQMRYCISRRAVEEGSSPKKSFSDFCYQLLTFLGTFSPKRLVVKGGTVLKFQDFSITLILREINFGDFRSAKSAI